MTDPSDSGAGLDPAGPPGMGLRPAPLMEGLTLYMVRRKEQIEVNSSRRFPRRAFPLQYLRAPGADSAIAPEEVPLGFFFRVVRVGVGEYIGTGRDPLGIFTEHFSGEPHMDEAVLDRTESREDLEVHFAITIPWFDELEQRLEIYSREYAERFFPPGAAHRPAAVITRADWKLQ